MPALSKTDVNKDSYSEEVKRNFDEKFQSNVKFQTFSYYDEKDEYQQLIISTTFLVDSLTMHLYNEQQSNRQHELANDLKCFNKVEQQFSEIFKHIKALQNTLTAEEVNSIQTQIILAWNSIIRGLGLKLDASNFNAIKFPDNINEVQKLDKNTLTKEQIGNLWKEIISKKGHIHQISIREALDGEEFEIKINHTASKLFKFLILLISLLTEIV